MDLAALGQLLVGISALLGVLWSAYHTSRQLQAVKKVAEDTHKEVKTINAQSLAQLADSDETRRISEKQSRGEKITEAEQEHISSVDEIGKHT